ncbi:MAG: metal ABC transporter ATP-binding protein [Elusimicrobia bacterium]|nr:metal ABC transporter ATP-binding protein [Elusimicrobiota bacterium]
MNKGPQPLVRFAGASLGYGRRPVLSGVDLTLTRGDFLGVLGPNGAGKSTVLKTMLGLLRPLKGKVELSGGAFGAPRFGYVPQKEKLDAIYPLTAYEVAEMGTFRRFELFKRLRRRTHDDVVRRAMKECGAWELAGRRYSDLSGGQRQRVLIARALAAEPELLVLDEPMSGIDVPTQKALLKLFLDFKERGLTVLMVSHRLQAERGLFTRVAWVEDGRVESGPAETMLAARRIAGIFGEDM